MGTSSRDLIELLASSFSRIGLCWLQLLIICRTLLLTADTGALLLRRLMQLVVGRGSGWLGTKARVRDGWNWQGSTCSTSDESPTRDPGSSFGQSAGRVKLVRIKSFAYHARIHITQGALHLGMEKVIYMHKSVIREGRDTFISLKRRKSC